jgi:hypothetical protein
MNLRKKLSKLSKIENIIYENNSNYYGNVKHGKPNGYGAYTHSNGDKDIGEWKDGKMCGQGQRLFTPMKETEENKHYDITFEEGTFENDTLQKGMRNTYFANKDGIISLSKREVGIFKSDFLVEGSETVFDLDSGLGIKKEIGKWRYDKEKNICEEFLSGEGEELYYKNEEDLINNKPLGYVKGLFKDGILIKGEVENASLIEYSAMKGIKKIIYKGYVGWSKNVHGEDTQIQKGEIYYEDGFVYKGEISFDLPHGKGTGTHKDGNSRTGNWFNGNLEDKLN